MSPHDPETAQRIVRDYAALLEEHAKQDVYPGVITTLPYSRDTIKTAIKCRTGTPCLIREQFNDKV